MSTIKWPQVVWQDTLPHLAGDGPTPSFRLVAFNSDDPPIVECSTRKDAMGQPVWSEVNCQHRLAEIALASGTVANRLFVSIRKICQAVEAWDISAPSSGFAHVAIYGDGSWAIRRGLGDETVIQGGTAAELVRLLLGD